MSVIHAIVLGIVQGLTEFIPVSSSGHLTLVPFILGWHEPSLAFVLAVHLGTLLAVTYVFRDVVIHVLRTAIGYRSAAPEEKRLVRSLFIATIPAVIVGGVFSKVIGDSFDKPVLVSLLLGVTGYWLVTCESRRREREVDPVAAQTPLRTEIETTDGDSVRIGVAQVISVLPGISRSGSTIGEAMRVGMTREGAVRFSFLMSIPVIFGAILTQIPSALHESAHGGGLAFLAGIATSAVVGFFSVKWTIGVVTRRGLRGFGLYCFAAMLAGLITALARG